MVTSASELEHVRVRAGSFNIADLNGEINCVLLGLKGSEKSVNVLCIVCRERALGVLYLENAEVKVVAVEGFECGSVDLVLELGDSQVLDFDWVSHSPLETNGGGWQVVNVLKQAEIGTTMECLALKVNNERLAV